MPLTFSTRFSRELSLVAGKLRLQVPGMLARVFQVRQEHGDLFRGVFRRRFEGVSYSIQSGEALADQGLGLAAGNGLDAAQPRPDAALADNIEKADLAG